MEPDETGLRRVGTIWALGLDQTTPVISPVVPAKFGRLGPEWAEKLSRAAADVADLGDGAAADLVTAEIRARFTAGKRCYAAWVGNDLAAYGWVSFIEEHIGELGLSLSLQPCEAYIWDCATLPEYRQKYLYSALLVYIL